MDNRYTAEEKRFYNRIDGNVVINRRFNELKADAESLENYTWIGFITPFVAIVIVLMVLDYHFNTQEIQHVLQSEEVHAVVFWIGKILGWVFVGFFVTVIAGSGFELVKRYEVKQARLKYYNEGITDSLNAINKKG